MRSQKEQAYAKINSFLAVTGRRPDGYHTLLSHMQAVSLCDELTVTWTPCRQEAYHLSLSCTDSDLACDESNLVCRAAKMMLDTVSERGVDVGGQWSFHLQKNIPMAAGLGGGSADAAATIRAINALVGEVLTMRQLCELGARIGADVPFCVCSARGAMTAQGIGEQLTAAPPLPEHAYLVIAVHGQGVSTPWAYRQVDELGTDSSEAERYAAFLEAVRHGDLATMQNKGVNCFEAAVIPHRPAVAAVMQLMRACGAPFVRMSGSGPSVVAAFEGEREATECLERLRSEGIWASACRPVADYLPVL